ncbi:ecto-ADP-ribosyltransferase 5-like isoform 1-T2 [Anomaloglossus baeobatrachus]|uniref:ecto-ADP-ribosyltransferase 5-like n=1 Tax=Anomaloglossus baeobatrachus TaxID=238106 RepID=UPI003F503E05
MSSPRTLFCCLTLAFLIIEQAFCLQVQLDMYEDSFDDQYIGCVDKMKSIAPELLKKEREQRPDLDRAWNVSSAAWRERKSTIGDLPSAFMDEHGTAVFLYTYMDIPLYKELNRAVREYGQDPGAFVFHSWHFYLTRALSLLRARCDGEPRSTYRGTSRVQFEPPSNPQDTIRLSQFSSTSSDVAQAQQFGNTSFFNISTCFGVSIKRFSYYPSQEEVLIPVDEVFHVTKYIKEGNKLVLQTTNRRCSFYNCAYLGGSKRPHCVYNSGLPTVKFIERATVPLLVAGSIAIITLTRFLIG